MRLVTLCRSAALGSRRDRGATAVEYAIVAALIAGVIVLAVGALGIQVGALFQAAADAFP